MGRLNLILVIMQVFFVVLNCVRGDDLKLGFYEESCPNAEKLVSKMVQKHVTRAPSLAAPLLRLHFHDCFVRGCDASVLIDSTSKNQAEKSSAPNFSLRQFEFIDRVKTSLEKKCPGVVSCADILALVARDAVSSIGGPSWEVPTGRRDGVISRSSEALDDIPAFDDNFGSLLNLFGSKGLNVTDLVLLSGAHTIGVAHCLTVTPRLYNFRGNEDTDPSLDSNYAKHLKAKCRSPTDRTSLVEMDPGSYAVFDLGYYRNLLKKRAVFESDDALTTDATALAIIEKLVNSPLETFFEDFALSMKKMGRIGVLTGTAGEIRKNCAVVNN